MEFLSGFSKVGFVENFGLSSEIKSYRLVSLNALTKGPFFNFDGKIAGLAQLSKLSIHDSKVNLVVEEGG